MLQKKLNTLLSIELSVLTLLLGIIYISYQKDINKNYSSTSFSVNIEKYVFDTKTSYLPTENLYIA